MAIKIIIKILKLYQKTISPNLGVFHLVINNQLPITNNYFGCRFYPSCSEYTIKSFERYGLMKAFFKSVFRILRCNPLNQGGVDIP